MTTKLQKCQPIATALNRLCRTQSVHHLRRQFIHNGPDTVEELLDRHLVKKDKKDSEENELLTRQRLTSNRREALSLYRDIIRATRFFMWLDSRGVLWRDVLRENARKEFEEARRLLISLSRSKSSKLRRKEMNQIVADVFFDFGSSVVDYDL
ncbi:unnamed protein product [Fraxinus pennsylvanica]|uniref:Complex 1 LYR protein n=1 Tax=Fraxinus pennsylvanica TaxID=56036 RepID=A0AAD1YLS9_9LAMI|nr:unnamed protein product [Fraxinus pennsylvanica]